LVNNPNSPNVPQKSADKVEQSMSGEVLAGSIAVPGTIIDAEGHTWTIPEDTLEEMVLYRSPFYVPNKDPRFHYQFEEESVISQLMTEGFRPVSRKELGLATFGDVAEYGHALDTYYKVGTQVCVKIPQVIADRRFRAAKRLADAAIEATEPPPPKNEEQATARAGAQYNKGGRKFDLTHEQLHVKPRNEANEVAKGQPV
jgi:hypothetical protein